MISFGLWLTLRGGREAAMRLLVTAAAVALGVGLLLATLAAINGVNAQNLRNAWLNSGVPGTTAAGVTPSPDPLWGTLGTDFYDGRRITRVDVAATGPQSPVPPGISRLPGPGEYFASPSLTELLRSQPASQLRDRYPGVQIGVIGKVALAAPDSLVIIVGRSVEELSHRTDAAQVTAIATRSPSDCSGCRAGTSANGMALILSVTSAALFFPVLIFIGTATRLAAARREQRFAAMRLVGATPRQVSVVSAVESTMAAILGTAVGFGLFAALRGPLATIPFTGERFNASDLALSGADIALVAVGVPIAAAIAARIALRRVRISPLGVSRRVTPRPPRAYRLIPLVAGIAELAYFVGRRPPTTNGQIRAYLPGIFLMMAGLVIAGPWLTMVGSRIMARRTNRTDTLIAARRLGDNPQAGFRAISGLVLALFVTTTAVGIITTMVDERGVPHNDQSAKATLLADYSQGWADHDADPKASVAAVPDTVVSALRSIPGVRGVAVIHTNPTGIRQEIGGWMFVPALVSCDQLADIPGFGRCAPGAQTAGIPPGMYDSGASEATRSATVWPASALSSEQLRGVPVRGVMVATDGSTAAIEQARSVLEAAFPAEMPPVTVAEQLADTDSARQLTGYEQLVNVVILVSLCIAGCSLAVSVVAGLNDRKRPFSLLRLTGVQLTLLRRIVALESAVPLLIVAVVATGAGFLAAALFLRSEMGYALHAPGAMYYVTVVSGIVVSLAVIASTLPLLRRITGPETARNE